MDNKYANLPGIAKNEPDCYETANVVVTSIKQECDRREDSDSIQSINVSTKEAHEKFNKTVLSSDQSDFSDSISNRKKFGYLVEPDVFEWNQDPVETPVQRFQRIEREAADLKRELTDLNKFVNQNQNENQPLGFNPIDLAEQVEKLQKQIGSLHLLSIGAKNENTDLQANKKLLVDHLNELKQSLAQKSKTQLTQAEQQSIQNSNSILFRVFANLEQIDTERTRKVSELNQRLANLERVFGAGSSSVNENQIAKLCSDIENKSILGLVEHLSGKFNLFDANSLEQVESRLSAVLQKVNQLNEKKGLLEDREKMQRINELYTMISDWKDASTMVPVVVEKLAALNEVHQKAFEFVSVLNRLDGEQEEMKQQIQLGTDTLNKLKQTLEENLDSIKNNFNTLNERILAIGSK